MLMRARQQQAGALGARRFAPVALAEHARDRVPIGPKRRSAALLRSKLACARSLGPAYDTVRLDIAGPSLGGP